MKRPKQHIVTAAGRGVGVTFTPAEEARVRGKAKLLGISVDALIEREINRRVRGGATTKLSMDERIVAPPTRKKKRRTR